MCYSLYIKWIGSIYIYKVVFYKVYDNFIYVLEKIFVFFKLKLRKKNVCVLEKENFFFYLYKFWIIGFVCMLIKNEMDFLKLSFYKDILWM